MDPGMMNIIFFAFFIGIFYFFFMRPSMKKQRAQDEFIKGLAKGDSVVTSSGIIGKITKIDEDGTVELMIDNKSFIKLMKSAISKENTDLIFHAKS